MSSKKHQNPGNWANNPKAAAEAGRKGGKLSSGNFKNDHERARAAGRKGGAVRALRLADV